MKQNHKKIYTAPNVEIVFVQVEIPIATSGETDSIGLNDFGYGNQDDLF